MLNVQADSPVLYAAPQATTKRFAWRQRLPVDVYRDEPAFFSLDYRRWQGFDALISTLRYVTTPQTPSIATSFDLLVIHDYLPQHTRWFKRVRRFAAEQPWSNDQRDQQKPNDPRVKSVVRLVVRRVMRFLQADWR